MRVSTTLFLSLFVSSTMNISSNPVKQNSPKIIVIRFRAVQILLKYPKAFARKMFGVLFTLADPFNLENRMKNKVRRIFSR